MLKRSCQLKLKEDLKESFVTSILAVVQAYLTWIYQHHFVMWTAGIFEVRILLKNCTIPWDMNLYAYTALVKMIWTTPRSVIQSVHRVLLQNSCSGPDSNLTSLSLVLIMNNKHFTTT